MKKQVFFGNPYWNQTTDNREKAVLRLSPEEFVQKKAQLDASGLNYYAYRKRDGVHMAFLKNQTEKMRFVLNEKMLQAEEPVAAHIPPQKNIFGNISFGHIFEKSYLYGSKQEQLKAAPHRDCAPDAPADFSLDY